ncbi:MAG: ribosome biogenesis GTPase Der [Alphaproteobacteria bacterium]|nr:ribosome biogenesis GTPase Der [Alphaproteobacteria bacterium]
MFTLALVGRPNVGKSTLFNRLAGKKLAIVDDTPGVTRDWRESEGFLFDRDFRIIDTAGLEERFDDSIQGRMRKQTEAGLDRADAVLFIVDGRAGITPMDQHFASWLRKKKKPVLLAVNKAEHDKAVRSAMAEAYALGLGEPIALSAEHGTGMETLYHALEALFPLPVETPESEEGETRGAIGDDDDIDALEGLEEFEFSDAEQDDPEKPIKIAIVGRPNVGKSTLLNAIVQDERVMTGPEAGITRDAIAVDWTYDGRPFRLVDTAGIRRKSKVQNVIEKMSVDDSLRAIRLAQVVILVLDASMIFEKQDLQIADHVIKEGRALVVAVNKWDVVEDRKKTLEDISYKLDTSLAQLKDVPVVTLSALKGGRNIEKLLKTVMETYGVWNARVKTGRLNRWLAAMESRNPAPLVDGRPNRLKYMAQIKTRPPTFALWASRPESLPDSYKRYLINALRRDYEIPGVPVRLLVRKSKNPYV